MVVAGEGRPGEEMLVIQVAGEEVLRSPITAEELLRAGEE